MGIFGKLFGKKAGDKAQDAAKTNKEVSTEKVKEQFAQTKEDLGDLMGQAEHTKAVAKFDEQMSVAAQSTADQYELIYRFNLANHLANKTGKTPAQCFQAIEKVYGA